METAKIYTLACPLTGEVRYLGKSIDPKSRFYHHVYEAPKCRTHKERWINNLLKQNLKPVLTVLVEVPIVEWEKWERHYIAEFRELGYRLTNGTDGGDGLENPSIETRIK